jgi:hypothetical protein
MRNRHLSDDQIQELLDAQAVGSGVIWPIHLGTCAGCRERLESFRLLYDGLAADPGFILPATFAGSVLDRIPVARPPFWLKPAFWIPLAVMTLILGSAGLVLFVDMKPLAAISMRVAASLAGAFRPLAAGFRPWLSRAGGSAAWFMLGGLSLLSAAFFDRFLQRHVLRRGH